MLGQEADSRRLLSIVRTRRSMIIIEFFDRLTFYVQFPVENTILILDPNELY
jgi:hypothetical protein